MSADVVMVGAGVIGCATALELARRGLSVTVLERGADSADAATRAAAGILGAQIHGLAADDHVGPLCRASRARYPAWIARIHEDSGIDTGYHASGALRIAQCETGYQALSTEVDAHRQFDLRAELLDARSLHELEPSLGPDVLGAALFVDDGVIDPRRLLSALQVAGERAGVTFRFEAPVAAIERSRVKLRSGEFVAADSIVVTAGAWSSLIEGMGIAVDAVRPARGQMVELRLPHPPLQRVVDGPDAYLSPRVDGRVLVGSTVEDVGFDTGVTAGAINRLISAALRMVPSLADADMTSVWSGLRPVTRDECPLLCRGPTDGVVFACGHFRNGVLLAPITADLVAQLITGGAVAGDLASLDLSPFDYRRLQQDHADRLP